VRPLAELRGRVLEVMDPQADAPAVVTAASGHVRLLGRLRRLCEDGLAHEVRMATARFEIALTLGVGGVQFHFQIQVSLTNVNDSWEINVNLMNLLMCHSD